MTTPQIPATEIVLSVPAGRSYDLVMEHAVYSCPDSKNYRYRRTRLITFRTAEGWMEVIYRIAVVHRADPRNLDAARAIPQPARERIRAYLVGAKTRRILVTPGSYRFYLLDENSGCRLSHKPRTARRLPGDAYFHFGDLTKGDRLVVPVDL